MENIVSKRQKQKYSHQGFIYVFDRMSACGAKLFWRCERKDDCKARIHTENGSVVKKVNDHSHDSSAARVEVQAAVSRIKERAGEVMETTAQVINACIGELSEVAHATMPSHGSLRKIIQRKRNLVRAAPPAPERVEDLIIPDEYKVYEPQPGIREDFLLADNGPVPGRILIFGRERNLRARMVVSLAFVPTGDLDAAIDRLADVLPVELQPLLQWFEDFYVGRLNRRGNVRRPAIFPPEMWSLYNRVVNDMDRTNNHAEAAHRCLQSEMGMDHPILWRFIDGLRKIQKGRDMFYEHLLAGHEPPKKLRKYRDADTRIKTIVADYANRDIIDYLRGISHNYEMNP
ncbi:hypothetical protein PPYR_02274 [Photinus pyralis]|uniref:FLYWCH-type domain-containing protein n=1 Tax=Photinus pyralis TaxID=7054 RepID=A0A5N4B6W8_PHOPY|nr:hypothetical protein PPYR_02274 [Photinus pyralis]